MKYQGLSNSEVANNRSQHGSNALTERERETLFAKLMDGFKDPMLLILIAALVINILFVIMGRADWYEAVGIFIAICIANFVGVFSESKQEDKAQELKEEELAKEKVKVFRNNELIEITINEVVVGDIVSLQAGDKVPSDGKVVQGEIKVDQATLNGETEEATKTAIGTNNLGDTRDLLNPYYVYRGTVVTHKECLVEVLKVGDQTLYGELALEMQEETRETPLKVKLNVLAGQISKFGYIGAIVISGAYLLQTLVLSGNSMPDTIGLIQILLDAVSLGVIIVVMAVPEGLPMMIALVLSMNMGKMMKDNVLVRKLNGIETAGGINILFSDKTGTITEGKLSVAELVTGNMKNISLLKSINNDLRCEIIRGIGINNSSTATDGNIIGGNSTDRALMNFLMTDDYNLEINKENINEFNAFDSNKKSSSVSICLSEGNKTYIKGAPERIVDNCTKYLDESGNVHEFKDKSNLVKYMDEQASRSMRLIAVATSDNENEEENLTLVAIISIRDNVRQEAAEAIKDVQNAGVQVVMVTGDRKETAIAIAREAGLLKSDTDIALTSAELNLKTDNELKELLPHLRVVSRALPMDKSRLVRIAQELDLVVAMTGDGTNDAPALKMADVGFAMGSGTEVAKAAGDIIILDDNFSSIKKAILYGRTIFSSIRKFLIFQLSVNVTTVALSFIAPFMGIAQPFSIISILVINLVMDALACLAFGNEPALERYMNDKPIGRQDSIVTKKMMSQIGLTGLYATVVGLFVLMSPKVWSLYAPGMELTEAYRESALMAFFMLTIVLNGINARSDNLNIFEHISENKGFIVVMGIVVLMLVGLIHIVAGVAGLTPITIRTWMVMLGFALLIIPIDMVRKVSIGKKA